MTNCYVVYFNIILRSICFIGISSIDDAVFTNDIVNDSQVCDFDETESISTHMLSSCHIKKTNGGKVHVL